MPLLVAGRSEFGLGVAHERNPVAGVLSDGRIRNGYEIRIANASSSDATFRLTVDGAAPATIAVAAERHGIDPKMLHALVIVESAYRVDAVSPVGAGGLTQLMPGTAADLAVRDRFDPIENLNGGADYLARQLLRFGDVRLAFAAYNSGPDRVARLGRIPNIAETQAYVAAAVDCYLALSAGRGARNSRQCRVPETDR